MRVHELPPAPICPVCRRPAEAQQTRFGVRHACCGLHSWGGKPLADQGTHDARKRAHEAFDALWRDPTLRLRRSRAYKLLAAELGVARSECHMALMSRELAEKVPAAAARVRAWLPKGEEEDGE